MKVAITGAGGFFGRHLFVRLRAQGSHEVVAITREVFSDPTCLARAVTAADVVVHLAGANRGDPAVVEMQNEILARQLVSALDSIGSSAAIVFANSIHAGTDTPYGRGKERAYDILHAWASRRGHQLINIVYQNLFGEGGRPDYNSFVATFCHRLASGGRPEIEVDRPLQVIHAQDAAQTLIDALPDAGRVESMTVTTEGVRTSVTGVLARLEEIRDTYAHGSVPDLGDRFTRQLFNTYRSVLFPSHYPFLLEPRTDARGAFVEAVRSFGGPSQTSYSTTVPGVTRGNHFHLEKVERFVVLRGRARIGIRPVYGSQVHLFELAGDQPAFVDIPTLHTHNITNVGDGELLTVFWADEIYNAAHSDTFGEPVW